MDKLFQIKIKKKNGKCYFHVIKINTIGGIVDAFNEYIERHKLGKHLLSRRSWSYTIRGSHLHRFENGLMRIEPLKIEDYRLF